MRIELEIKGNLCPYYPNTNEDLEHIVGRLNLDGKNVLSVLGSGSISIEFLRLGANHVVAVDEADIQLFWAQLYKTSIETLSYRRFKEIFFKGRGRDVLARDGSYRKAITDAFGQPLSEKCLEELEDPKHIRKENFTYPAVRDNFFVALWCVLHPKYYRWAASEVEYQKVQSKLRSEKLTLKKGVIPKVWTSFGDGTFDVIYLSNIIEWLGRSDLAQEELIAKQSARILTPNGTLYSAKVRNDRDLNRRLWVPHFDVDEDKQGYVLRRK